MSKKKNLTTLKDLSRTIGNKTPVQLVSSMVVKKKGKYHLTGSKEEKKIILQILSNKHKSLKNHSLKHMHRYNRGLDAVDVKQK